MNQIFPFTAICAQEDLKLTLVLCMIDPTLGGVLVLGDKGTGKTTTVRALAGLMKKTIADFSFVNLPIGATEDRVLGAVKLDVLMSEKRVEVQKGLLAKANNGVLYIDEINLLNDYLMDVLIDAASAGGYNLERDSISQWLDSQFCLVGTMNPEEGELRPQLLDRFGLCVTVKTPMDKKLRTTIMKQRLAFDTNPVLFIEQFQAEELQLAMQIQAAKQRLNSVIISPFIQEEIASTCIESNVEGLRADILIMKAARAYAAFNNQHEVCAQDVLKVKEFVLAHRSKTNSKVNEEQDPPSGRTTNPGNKTEKQKEAEQSAGLKEYLVHAHKTEQYLKPEPTSSDSKKGLNQKSLTSFAVHKKNNATDSSLIDLYKTVKKYIIHERFSICYKTTVSKAGTKIIFLIDSSSSMLQNKQIAFVKGMINQTVHRYRKNKICYAVIALSNGTARVAAPLTMDRSILETAVEEIRAGGKTNLKAGLNLVYQLLKSQEQKMNLHQLFILTDGQMNVGETSQPFSETVNYHKTFLRFVQTTVVDMERGFVRLGLAKKFATQINSRYQLIN